MNHRKINNNETEKAIYVSGKLLAQRLQSASDPTTQLLSSKIRVSPCIIILELFAKKEYNNRSSHEVLSCYVIPPAFQHLCLFGSFQHCHQDGSESPTNEQHVEDVVGSK